MFGKDSTAAVTVTTNKWGTAGTVGANDGFLPVSIDPVVLKGDINIDDASGLSRKSQYDLIQDNAEQTIVVQMRWNGIFEWLALAHWMGDDTKTGAGPTYTHTMNFQQISNLTQKGLTVAWRLDSSNNNSIGEVPSLKPQNITLEPSDGFWNMSVSTIGSTIYQAGDGNITADSTAIGNVTYRTQAQRMKFKANQLRMNAQAGAGLGSGDVLSDVSNISIVLDRPYDDMKDVLLGSTLPRQNAEPIQNDHSTITLNFDQKTYDVDTHRSDLDSGNEYKADLIQTQSISGNSHSFTSEFGRLIPMDPQVALERGLRIPMTHNYEAIKPSSTPTGMNSSNEFHVILVNTSNISYESNS